MFYFALRSLLFCLTPEASHHFALSTLKFAYSLGFIQKFGAKDKGNPTTVMGIKFPNRIGLAAGLDKNAQYITPLASLGFGFIEVGTITPEPQHGNPKPRLFRLPKANALINRLGFNSRGLDYCLGQIKKSHYQGILGINIGKNLMTPIERAIDDYIKGFRAVYPYASYITINISSPNTPGLRGLQYGNYLKNLLATLKKLQAELRQQYNKYVPFVVKISPDLTEEELAYLAQEFLTFVVDGVIATNTTITREGVQNVKYANEKGGLSGTPLFSRTLNIVKQLNKLLDDKIPIIGCGGITSREQAKEMLQSGASLIQLYTGLIYRGPQLIRECTLL